MVNSNDIIDIIRLYRAFPKYNFISEAFISQIIAVLVKMKEIKLIELWKNGIMCEDAEKYGWNLKEGI